MRGSPNFSSVPVADVVVTRDPGAKPRGRPLRLRQLATRTTRAATAASPLTAPAPAPSSSPALAALTAPVAFSSGRANGAWPGSFRRQGVSADSGARRPPWGPAYSTLWLRLLEEMPSRHPQIRAGIRTYREAATCGS